MGTHRSSLRGRKRRLKERIKTPTTLGVNPMAKVTYRGHEYDTEEYRNALIAEHTQQRNYDLMYRGIKVKSKAVPCS